MILVVIIITSMMIIIIIIIIAISRARSTAIGRIQRGVGKGGFGKGGE